MEKYDTKVIVNVCGHSTEEYLDVVERLADEPRVDMLEINISCPNARKAVLLLGRIQRQWKPLQSCQGQGQTADHHETEPNVTDITVMAKAAEPAAQTACL